MPKLTSVIVTYNGAAWIQRCLSSLIVEGWQHEIWVIDNGSSDTTCDIIETDFPHVQLIRGQENLGFGVANNIGMSRALEVKADFCLLLNQDAWFQSGSLAQLLDTAQKYNNTPYGIYSPIHLTGKGDQLDYNFSRYLSKLDSKAGQAYQISGKQGGIPLEIPFVNAAAWLLTRECLEKVGGFDPMFFMYSEDNDYIQRLHFQGLTLAVVPEVFVHHDRAQRANNLSFERKCKLEQNLLFLRQKNPTQDFEAAFRKERWFLLRSTLTQSLQAKWKGARLHFRLLQSLYKNKQRLHYAHQKTRLHQPSYLDAKTEKVYG